MFEAGADPVFDDVHEERVRTERRSDEIADTGVAFGRFGGERGDIAVPMIAGPEEIRCDDDRARAGGYARVERGCRSTVPRVPCVPPRRSDNRGWFATP